MLRFILYIDNYAQPANLNGWIRSEAQTVSFGISLGKILLVTQWYRKRVMIMD